MRSTGWRPVDNETPSGALDSTKIESETFIRNGADLEVALAHLAVSEFSTPEAIAPKLAAAGYRHWVTRKPFTVEQVTRALYYLVGIRAYSCWATCYCCDAPATRLTTLGPGNYYSRGGELLARRGQP